MSKTKYIFLLIFCVFIQNAEGQRKRVLTFDESLDIALRQSYSIKRASIALLGSKNDVKAARAGLKSYAFFETDLPKFDQAISQEFNSGTQTYDFFKTQTMRYESRISINQPLPTNGKISVNGAFFKLIQSGDIEDYASNIILRFSQPIFTHNRLKQGIRHAELRLEQQRLEYIDECLEIIEDVTDEFYELYEKTLEVRILEEEAIHRENSYKVGKEKFKNKEIDEISVLQLEVDLAMAKDRLLQDRTELENMKDAFKQTIGLDLNDEIEIATDLIFTPVEIDLNKALKEGMENRIDIQRNKINEELIRMWMTDIDSWSEFKGEITATYGLNKADERFRSAFENFDKTRSMVVKFTIPLWDWGKNRAEVERVETVMRKHHAWMEQNLKNIKVQIINSISETTESIDRLKVLEKNQALAIKTYELTRSKYAANLVDSETLNLAQRRLTNSKNSYVGAFVKYKNALAQLTINSTWNFEQNRSVLGKINNLLREVEKSDD